VNRWNRALNLVSIPRAMGEDLYRFVTMVTNTWFKT